MSDLERMNGFDPKRPTSLELTDAIDSMTDRALGIINLLQNNFLDENHFKAPDKAVLNALESIYLEVADIKKVTEVFYDSQKKEGRS